MAESFNPSLKLGRTRLQTKTQINSIQNNGIVLPECQPGTSTGTWTCPSPAANTKSSTGPRTKSSAASKTKSGRKLSTNPRKKRGRKSRRGYRDIESDTDSVQEPEDKFFVLDYEDYLLQYDEDSDSDIPVDPFFEKDYDEFIKKSEERTRLSQYYDFKHRSENYGPGHFSDGSYESAREKRSASLEKLTEVNSETVFGPDEETIVSDNFEDEDKSRDFDDREPLHVTVRRWLKTVRSSD